MWIILVIYLLVVSIFLSTKLKFKNFSLNLKELIKKDKTSLFLTLGTKLGVGSIIGTVSSILIGGFSSVIWIILFSFVFSSITYYESYYGNKYKRLLNNTYIGGPYFIFRYGLNKKKLSIISLIILIILYSFLFQMVQFNTISYMLINVFKISKSLIVIVSMGILIITLSLSIKEILNILNKLVPYMCIVFIFVCIYIIIDNINNININIFFKDFMSLKSILSGSIIGIKRSIFMNEILIGTTSTSSSSDKNDINISIKYQILSIYFISIIITILMTTILLIYINNNSVCNDYNLLIINMFHTLLGNFGIYFLLITYLLFGVTTILSGYYIGVSNLEYISRNKIMIKVFKTIFIITCILGILLNNNHIWKYLDVLIFIMIIINSYSIISLVMYDDRK